MFEHEEALRSRLAADLKIALRARDAAGISAIRGLVAAIDNAGAVATTALNVPVHGRSGDVPRRDLSPADLRGLLAAEIVERHDAISMYEAGRQLDAAERLRAELRVLTRYGEAP